MGDIIHEYDNILESIREPDEEYVFRLKPGALTALVILTVMSSL